MFSRHFRLFLAIVCLIAVALVIGEITGCRLRAEESRLGEATPDSLTGVSVQDTTALVVTPVTGPSWTKQLGLPSTTATAMGRL